MIDALFGSKTRVKLLYLFLNNPGKAFYVREITRLIGEQINSVRRELANMIEVGIITSDSADNKLYYQVNQRYSYYIPLKSMFSQNTESELVQSMSYENSSSNNYTSIFNGIGGLRVVIVAGVLVKDSTSPVDVLVVGNTSANKIKLAIKSIESSEGRDINYSMMSYDEFYYRLSVRDKFVNEIMNAKHEVIVDKDKILEKLK